MISKLATPSCFTTTFLFLKLVFFNPWILMEGVPVDCVILLVWPPGPLDSSDHQDYETWLGSGIPNLTFTFHCYREGAISKWYCCWLKNLLATSDVGRPFRPASWLQGLISFVLSIILSLDSRIGSPSTVRPSNLTWNLKKVGLGRCFSFFLRAVLTSRSFVPGVYKMGPYYIVANGVITPINSLING